MLGVRSGQVQKKERKGLGRREKFISKTIPFTVLLREQLTALLHKGQGNPIIHGVYFPSLEVAIMNFGDLAIVGKDAASGRKDLVRSCMGYRLLRSYGNLALYGVGAMAFLPKDHVLP